MYKFTSIFWIVLLIGVKLQAQQQNDIPANANTIIVKGVTFKSVCMSLLDSGYVIDKKDNDLETVSTLPKEYPKMYNAVYIVNVRVKDSIAYFTGTFTAPPGGGLFFNEPITNHCNKKGKPYPKSFSRYPFMLVNTFVTCFNKEITYAKL